MKNVLVLAAISLVATSANAAEMKWSGSAGWRYEQAGIDNNGSGAGGGIGTTRAKANNVRANIGVSGGWENVEWGSGIRTQNRNGGVANDDHANLQNATDLGVGFEQAWFRYVKDFGSLDLAVTAGRQKNVFIYDNVAQTLFDNDVRFDGLGESLRFGMFGLNLGQYVLGARTDSTVAGLAGNSGYATTDANEQRNFQYLFGFQPHMSWKFSDDIEAMFAVGYYIWKDEGQVNNIAGDYNAANDATLTAAQRAANGFRLRDSRQWQFSTSVTLPYNLSFNGEFVMNKKQQYDGNSLTAATTSGADADRTAWSAGLTYGALKKAHDFSVGYAYGVKGLASVADAYSYERFLAGNQGHTISANYAIADNFTVGWKGLFLKEKNNVAANGAAYTGAQQQSKTNYWQLTAGVMF